MSVEPEPDRLYQEAELARFYDIANGWSEDLGFCAGLAGNARSVLDLGCGTGRLIAHLADGRRAAGVDPARPMLAIARARPGGARATWIEADARNLRLDETFDLVVLTGHAFQVFLGEADRRAVLEAIARHLGAQGRFVFDSRNPLAVDLHTWTPEQSHRRLEDAELGTIECWNDVEQDPLTGIVSYETHYVIRQTGAHHWASSKIAFPDRNEISRAIGDAGLQVDEWMGDWRGGPCTDAAPDIVPLGRLA